MPSNTLLTTDQITLKSLALLRNTNFLLSQVNRKYEPMFENHPQGAIGASVRIRMPAYYDVRTVITASPQATVETYQTLTIDTIRGLDVNFTSQERLLNLNDFGDTVLSPAVNRLASSCSAAIFTKVGAAQNIINTNATAYNDSTQVSISPTVKSWLLAGAALTQANAPMNDRVAVLSPTSQANAVAGMAGYFNAQSEISAQFRSGFVSQGVLGVERWGVDQMVPTVTAGTLTAAAVNGATQTGPTLTVTGITGTLKAGTFITIAGVNARNVLSGVDTGQLQQFVLTADAAGAATTISISPTMIATGPGANVTALPGATAVITPSIKASTVFRQNLLFHKDAITICFADLPKPAGAVTYSRKAYDGVSIRLIDYYDGTSDVSNTRMDILFGIAILRPSWMAIVSDVP